MNIDITKVDIVDLNNISDVFYNIIDQQKVNLFSE